MPRSKVTKNSDETMVIEAAPVAGKFTAGLVQPVPIQEFEPVNKKVQVTTEVQLYTKPNLNPSLMAEKLRPGLYEITDVMKTIQGRFFRLRNKKYILEGPNTILK